MNSIDNFKMIKEKIFGDKGILGKIIEKNLKTQDSEKKIGLQ